jgi:hypothetical protein
MRRTPRDHNPVIHHSAVSALYSESEGCNAEVVRCSEVFFFFSLSFPPVSRDGNLLLSLSCHELGIPHTHRFYWSAQHRTM